MASRAKETHTTNRVVRVDDELWPEYRQACADEGVTASEDLRTHMRRKIASWRRRQAARLAAQPLHPAPPVEGPSKPLTPSRRPSLIPGARRASRPPQAPLSR